LINFSIVNDFCLTFIGATRSYDSLNLDFYAYFMDMFLSDDTSVHNPIDSILQDSFSVFHVSVPNIKLYYPEPFIATPTFIHDDI
jgi:hypothetical protein